MTSLENPSIRLTTEPVRETQLQDLSIASRDMQTQSCGI